MWIAVLVIGICAIGTAGWFGYKKIFPPSKEIPADTIVNKTVPETVLVDTTAKDTIVAEPPKAAVPEQPKVKTTTLSKTDQENAKQKPKEPGKTAPQTNAPSQQVTTPAKQTKPDQVKNVSPDTTRNENITKVILEVGRKDDPKNKNPKNPARLLIRKPTMIVRITTDHYNDGNGTPSAGTLSIKDRDGNIVGTYSTDGKSGINGIPNSKWVAEPNQILEKGTYYIWDSDMLTWSKNIVGMGCVVVEGYEIK
jgi:hypothetical protein